MKKISLAISLFILSALAVNAGNYSFIKEYPVSKPASLKISTSGGGISVQGYDKDIIEVKFIVKKKNEVLAITFEQLSQYADCEITSDKQGLTINVKKIKESNTSVGFEVRTPTSTQTNLHTDGGGIVTGNLTGDQTCSTDGGGIVYKQITGNINCNTSGGGIVISNVKGRVSANTSGGGISLTDVDGSISSDKVHKDIDIKTSGGALSLISVVGSIEAITDGGGIIAKITTLNKQLKLKTSGGSISAELPNGSYDLDIRGNKINAQLANFDGINNSDKIKGKLNGGGVPVEISTDGGHVQLAFN